MVRSERVRRGMSQAELSEVLKCSQERVSQLERGRVSWRIRDLYIVTYEFERTRVSFLMLSGV